MLEEDWGHVADWTGKYLHLAEDLPSVHLEKQQKTFYMKIWAIKGNLDVPHKDWEAREELILYQENINIQLAKPLLERPDTYTIGHPWKHRPKPTKGREQ